MEELKGNREGSIYKDGNSVLRPLNTWSKSVHLYLAHLEKLGLAGIPRLLAVNETSERLSYVEGVTTDFPLLGEFADKNAIVTCAKLLRNLHNCSESFISSYDVKNMDWMLPSMEPIEVICHGDFAPYNCAFKGKDVVGVFDFDTVHPAPRVWDLAYSVYCWSPLKSNKDESCAKSLAEQINRAKVFCDAYGATHKQRQELPKYIAKRLNALVSFMLKQAALENTQFSENIEDGHHLSYLEDIDYVLENESEIIKGVI